jgi:hypothetical protein
MLLTSSAIEAADNTGPATFKKLANFPKFLLAAVMLLEAFVNTCADLVVPSIASPTPYNIVTLA